MLAYHLNPKKDQNSVKLSEMIHIYLLPNVLQIISLFISTFSRFFSSSKPSKTFCYRVSLRLRSPGVWSAHLRLMSHRGQNRQFFFYWCRHGMSASSVDWKEDCMPRNIGYLDKMSFKTYNCFYNHLPSIWEGDYVFYGFGGCHLTKKSSTC